MENLDVRLKNKVDLDIWGSSFANESNQWLSINDLDSLHFKWWIPASLNNIGVYWCPVVITFADFLVLFVLEGLARRALAPDFRKLERYLAVLLEKTSSRHHTIDINFSNYFLGVHEIPQFSPWGLAALLWPQERWKLWTACGTAKSWENRWGKCENYGKHVETHGGGSIKKQKEPQILVYVHNLYLISS